MSCYQIVVLTGVISKQRNTLGMHQTRGEKKCTVHFQDIRMFLQMFLAIFSAFHVTLAIHHSSFLLCRKDGSVHVAHFGAPVVPTSRALNDTCSGAGAHTRTCSTSVPSGATDLTVHQDHNVSCCRYVVIQI